MLKVLYYLYRNYTKRKCRMNNHQFKKDILQLSDWYHKLIFLVGDYKKNTKTSEFINGYELINVNPLLSEKLLNISQSKYPLYIKDYMEDFMLDQSKIYVLEMIDILFDPALQIHPIRLLENLSKAYKLIVIWPGEYSNSQLSYAEYGHPEYFSCKDFEGKVYVI